MRGGVPAPEILARGGWEFGRLRLRGRPSTLATFPAADILGVIGGPLDVIRDKVGTRRATARKPAQLQKSRSRALNFIRETSWGKAGSTGCHPNQGVAKIARRRIRATLRAKGEWGVPPPTPHPGWRWAVEYA